VFSGCGSWGVLARLPGPPYQFLDCITAVTGEPFVLKAGAACEAKYAVPPDASSRATTAPLETSTPPSSSTASPCVSPPGIGAALKLASCVCLHTS